MCKPILGITCIAQQKFWGVCVCLSTLHVPYLFLSMQYSFVYFILPPTAMSSTSTAATTATSRDERPASPPAPNSIVFDNCDIIIRGDVIARVKGDVYYENGRYYTPRQERITHVRYGGGGSVTFDQSISGITFSGNSTFAPQWFNNFNTSVGRRATTTVTAHSPAPASRPPSGTRVVAGDRIQGDPLRNVFTIRCENEGNVSWQDFVRPEEDERRMTVLCLNSSMLTLFGMRVKTINLTAKQASRINIDCAKGVGPRDVTCIAESASKICLLAIGTLIPTIKISCSSASNVSVKRAVRAKVNATSASCVKFLSLEEVEYNVSSAASLIIPENTRVDEDMSTVAQGGNVAKARVR